MKKCRIVSVVLAMLLIIGLIAACGEPSETPVQTTTDDNDVDVTDETTIDNDVDPEDIKLVRYLVPGNAQPESDHIDQLISEKMQEDGLYLELNRIYMDWDIWDNRVNVMMATGEEFELIHVMQDRVRASIYYGRGGIVSIDEFIDQYGSTLREIIPAEIWDILRIEGGISGIPVHYRDFAYVDGPIAVQRQYLDRHDMDMPDTPRGFLDAMIEIDELEPDIDFRYANRVNALTHPALHRSYDSYPFIVIEDLIYVDQQGNVEAWLKTDEFKKDADFWREMYENGFINPDLLTMPNSEINAQPRTEDWLFRLKQASTYEEAIRERVPDLELEHFWVNYPEVPKFRGNRVINNINAVSSTTPNPEVGVQFFNWLYNSQANFDLMSYGVEGTHWEALPDREFRRPDSELEDPQYTWSGDWVLGHYTLVRVAEGTPDFWRQAMLEFDPDAVNSIAAGFNFDSEPVSVEYMNLMAELESLVFPIKYGIQSYDDAYDSMIQQMETAGYDVVVDEFRRQFEAFLANQ